MTQKDKEKEVIQTLNLASTQFAQGRITFSDYLQIWDHYEEILSVDEKQKSVKKPV